MWGVIGKFSKPKGRRTSEQGWNRRHLDREEMQQALRRGNWLYCLWLRVKELRPVVTIVNVDFFLVVVELFHSFSEKFQLFLAETERKIALKCSNKCDGHLHRCTRDSGNSREGWIRRFPGPFGIPGGFLHLRQPQRATVPVGQLTPAPEGKVTWVGPKKGKSDTTQRHLVHPPTFK